MTKTKERTTTAWVVRLASTLAGVTLGGCAAWALADPNWVERHVLGSYCPTSLPQWVMARTLRWAAAAVAVVAALAAPALARRALRASPRPTAGSVVAILGAVALSLGLSELVMRRMHDRLALGAQPAAAGRRAVPMTRPDARLGWSYFPRRTTWVEMGGRRIPYSIDANGDRAASQDALPDPDRPTILFAGESIAFGYGLPYEETFPSLVGRDLGIQAVNLAVVGYGNDQAHLRVLDALERYRRPLAIVTLFVPDEIRRNVDIWRPRLALGPGGALVSVPPSTGPRIAKLLQQLPYHGDDALRVTAAILRATADAARARGAFPLFVVTNYGPACLREDGEEAWIIEELFVRPALPFVRVDLDPEDLLPGLLERHPSLRGTRKLAAAIERALAGHDLPPKVGDRRGSALLPGHAAAGLPPSRRRQRPARGYRFLALGGDPRSRARSHARSRRVPPEFRHLLERPMGPPIEGGPTANPARAPSARRRQDLATRLALRWPAMAAPFVLALHTIAALVGVALALAPIALAGGPLWRSRASRHERHSRAVVPKGDEALGS